MRLSKLLLAIVLLLCSFASEAQKSKGKKSSVKHTVTKPKQQAKTSKTKEQPKQKEQSKTKDEKPQVSNNEDEQKVKDIVAFLEYVLNTLGSKATSTRDKDVLITESYSKIFRDAKVQVEDDLDEERFVITNKDVVAYLKDVDFFFSDVKFEFNIESVKSSTLSSGTLFYKVSTRRMLTGITADGKKITNTTPRFIEINYNPDDQDLKIVSIYTNEFNEKEALTNWWKELSYEWKAIFKQRLSLTDSVSLENIKAVTSINALDLNGNKFIQNIEPLAQLFDLRTLNLSNTNIEDLTPIRNLTELSELDLSHTKVFDLTPLKYVTKLSRLKINETDVRSISALEKMELLEVLEMKGAHVVDFNPIRNFRALKHLNLQHTLISDLKPLMPLSFLEMLNISQTPVQQLPDLDSLKSLREINIDSTAIRTLQSLSKLSNLEVLSANYTLINNLDPLHGLQKLEKVYCDHTLINREASEGFMSAKPSVLVVVDSKDLFNWWSNLSLEWKQVFSKAAKIKNDPEKDDLARVINLDSINITNLRIDDIQPLEKLQRIKTLIAAKTSVSSLQPLRNHKHINYLDVSASGVSDISAISNYAKIKTLRIEKTSISNIDTLAKIKSLQVIYADDSQVSDKNVKTFLNKNSACLIVYKTDELITWWQSLSSDWKSIFSIYRNGSNTESLHQLIERNDVTFRDVPVNDLTPLNKFLNLKSLTFSGTAVNHIPSLEILPTLEKLIATNSPVRNIGALNECRNLKHLDLSNTPIEELDAIHNLFKLEILSFAGTQVKKLDVLERLGGLKSVDCSNTEVKNLKPLYKLHLESLKCYNTRVSSKEVEKLKEKNPGCNVVFYR